MAEITTSEIPLSTLPTKSVTITPQRATIIREIHTKIPVFTPTSQIYFKTNKTQTGQHTLTITGLDPTVEIDSIRIEGTGAATVTDIQTEIVSRREGFDDVYPVESEEERVRGESEGELDAELREEMVQVEGRVARARDEKAMAESMQGFLDEYGKKMEPGSADVGRLEEFLQMYARLRMEGSERYRRAVVDVVEGERELARLREVREGGLKEARREREKREGGRRRRRELRERVRRERRMFWTEMVAQVVVHLDRQSVVTSGSSRRGSVIETEEEPVDVALRLGYVVPGVSWSSRYELRINTPSSSARMAYRAEFRNSSSETWTDARVTLSTSQASFSGLEQRIPSLLPWHIKLLDSGKEKNHDHPSWEKILHGGYANWPQKSVWPSQNTILGNAPAQTSSKPLFGGPSQPAPSSTSLFGAAPAQNQPPSSSSLFGSRAAQTRPEPPAPSVFGSVATQNQQGSSGGLFGGLTQTRPTPSQTSGSNEPPAQQASSGGLFGGARERLSGISIFKTASVEPSENRPGHESSPADHDAEEEEYEHDASTSLEQQESLQQDYGLTTTYDLPGHRTLIPSANNRRHVLADVDLKSVTLSHIIIPKHRAEAFYRARIKNTSSLRILRGKVGLTVDGTFLGTATVPNCAPGGFFNVSLGVDPAILVTYGKPTMRTRDSGFFTAQHGAVFRRTCWIKNTKSTAVDITVLDQVPVSEDTELEVEVLEPKGLNKDGDEAKLEIEASHGKGRAIREKKAEIKWEIQLEPGKDVRVVLEYGTKVPWGTEVDTA
ncbi:hypothetical protein BDV28DRAFT_150257 [Aspergillus coremiiformis]|uniref:DUF4139 domain-containing protein n=1 Tax=Aspergillus coremiiformis TaxID=138285 RepID=A0A5N6Z0D6_9EURO|nr:hypothetical protein BDV28DRAFT_150257 [Aspergillus coremiiformis]